MLIDNYFDQDAAGKALNVIVRAHAQSITAQNDPAQQHMTLIDNERGEVDMEMVIRVQGILAKVELVPGNVSKFNMKRAANLSRRVQLIGARSPLFETAVSNTKVVQDVFVRFFRGKRVNEWSISEDLTETYLNASNRFFTTVTDNPKASMVLFGDGVDPLGVFTKLQHASGGQLVHTDDNVVHYFKLAKDPATELVDYFILFLWTIR
ncbi:hypothetical protein B0H11DRAFT_2232228 [Mycena galericulata]|nr:hypothetical protein B0H11DRAFT_2232228 [Mycena galericulata]